MKRFANALFVMAGIAGCAQAADLPATKVSELPVAGSCFRSVWDWLNASVSDCPFSYAGFTIYGTIDAGYGYDTAGVRLGKWYDKGVFYTIQKTSDGARWSWSPNALRLVAVSNG